MLLIYLGITIGVMATTLCWPKVFKPLRAWARRKNDTLGDFLCCPYCVSHWLSFAAVILYKPVVVHSSIPLVDWWVSAMLLVFIASITSGTIVFSFSRIDLPK